MIGTRTFRKSVGKTLKSNAVISLEILNSGKQTSVVQSLCVEQDGFIWIRVVTILWALYSVFMQESRKSKLLFPSKIENTKILSLHSGTKGQK